MRKANSPPCHRTMRLKEKDQSPLRRKDLCFHIALGPQIEASVSQSPAFPDACGCARCCSAMDQFTQTPSLPLPPFFYLRLSFLPSLPPSLSFFLSVCVCIKRCSLTCDQIVPDKSVINKQKKYFSLKMHSIPLTCWASSFSLA